jgi:hypothetical protein
MFRIKHFFPLGILLLALLSQSADGNALNSNCKVDKTGTHEKGREGFIHEEDISEIKAVLEPSVKLSETNSFPRQSVKSGKRLFLLNVSTNSASALHSSYSAYSTDRTNRFNFPPFYIIFRSILI